MTPDQEKLHKFETKNCDVVWKAAFDNNLGIPEVRILIILLSQVANEEPQLYSTRAISKMIDTSHTTAARAIKKLLDLKYVVNIDNNYFLGAGFRVKNETDSVSKMKRGRVKNETTIIQTNNTKKEEESSSNEAPLPPEILELSKETPTMKQQLKGAVIVVDDKGRNRVKLTNGKMQDPIFKHLFFTNKERKLLETKFEQVFQIDWTHYITLAFTLLDRWIDDHKTKGGALKSHYQTILKWPLPEAEKRRAADLWASAAERQNARYSKGM